MWKKSLFLMLIFLASSSRGITQEQVDFLDSIYWSWSWVDDRWADRLPNGSLPKVRTEWRPPGAWGFNDRPWMDHSRHPCLRPGVYCNCMFPNGTLVLDRFWSYCKFYYPEADNEVVAIYLNQFGPIQGRINAPFEQNPAVRFPFLTRFVIQPYYDSKVDNGTPLLPSSCAVLKMFPRLQSITISNLKRETSTFPSSSGTADNSTTITAELDLDWGNETSSCLCENLQSSAGLSEIRLAHLQLSGSRFPYWWLDKCNITHLDLSNVGLIGNDLFSEENDGGVGGRNMSHLASLVELNLNNNALTGTFPIHLPPNIEEFKVSNNALEGTIPEDLPSGLERLIAGSNRLTGSLPNRLADKIEEFDISRNQITGTISEVFISANHSASTVFLIIYDNQINGTLPKCVAYLSYVEAGFNRITGSLPESWHLEVLSEDAKLTNIDLSFNRISGLSTALPASLTNLDLTGNGITGTLPQEWENSSLQFLKLGFNRLTGQLPSWCSNSSSTLCSKIFGVDMYNNELAGTLPSSWANLTGARYFKMSFNRIGGTLPDEWKALANTFHIDLSGNRLEGSLPCEWEEFPFLIFLELNDNKFSGTFPECWLEKNKTEWHQGSALFALELSGNRLNGTLPTILKNKNWRRLELAGNLFEGTIPSGIRSLSLALGANNLSGTVPTLLPPLLSDPYHLPFDLSLDLSDNPLIEGEYPVRQAFSQLSQLSLRGTNVKVTTQIESLSSKAQPFFPPHPSVHRTTDDRWMYFDFQTTNPDNRPVLTKGNTPASLDRLSSSVLRNMNVSSKLWCDVWNFMDQGCHFSIEEEVSCYDAGWGACISVQLFTVPFPTPSKRAPVFGTDRFSETFVVFFKHTVLFPWQARLLIRNADINLYSTKNLLRPTEKFISNRYSYTYQAFIVPVKVISSSSSNTSSSYQVGENIPSLLKGEEDQEDLIPSLKRWNRLNDPMSLEEAKQTTGLLAGPVLTKGFLDPLSDWKNISLRHDIDYVVELKVIVFDQWSALADFKANWPEEVPLDYGVLNFTVHSDPFRRAPCSDSLLAVPNTTTCVKCPEGFICNGTSIIVSNLQPPSWRMSTDLLPAFPCAPENEGCVPSSSAAECKDSYVGPFCSLCEVGYGYLAGTCHECPSTEVSVLISIAMALSTLIYTSFVVRGVLLNEENPKPPRFPVLKAVLEHIAIPMKIVLNHLSLMGLVGQTKVSSSLNSADTADIFSAQYVIGNFAIYDALSIKCLQHDFGAASKFMVALALVVGLVVAETIFVKVISKVKSLRRNSLFRIYADQPQLDSSKKSLLTVEEGKDDGNTDTSTIVKHEDEEQRSGRSAAATSHLPWLCAFVCFLRVVHPTIISASASLLPCEQFDFFNLEAYVTHERGTPLPAPSETLSLLVHDYSTKCDSPGFFKWQVIGWIALLGFGLGVPLVTNFVIWRVSKKHGPEHRSVLFGFLVDDFSEERWYWECAIMMRELAGFLIISVLLDSNFQLLAMNTMFVIWFTVHTRALPFSTTALNKTEYFSVASAFISLNLLTILQVYNQREATATENDRHDLADEARKMQRIAALIIMIVQLSSLIAVSISALLFLIKDVKAAIATQTKRDRRRGAAGVEDDCDGSKDPIDEGKPLSELSAPLVSGNDDLNAEVGVETY